jgi:citronellol/citronellal dehydrogenase
MWDVNMRATFLASQACIPHLRKSANPHILTMSPPLNMQAKWFAPHVAYSISKYGMSLCAHGMAMEFAGDGIAVNCLWPRTVIATAAVEFNFPSSILRASRHPAIMADAAHHILTRNSRDCTGNFFVDEDLLRATGVKDFEQYATTPGTPLFEDFFLDPAV